METPSKNGEALKPVVNAVMNRLSGGGELAGTDVPHRPGKMAGQAARHFMR